MIYIKFNVYINFHVWYKIIWLNPYIGGLDFYTIFLFKVHIKFNVYINFNIKLKLNFCEWKESIVVFHAGTDADQTSGAAGKFKWKERRGWSQCGNVMLPLALREPDTCRPPLSFSSHFTSVTHHTISLHTSQYNAYKLQNLILQD